MKKANKPYYDPTYNITKVANQKDSGEVITQFKYDYDKVGNKLDATDNIGKTTYDYDKQKMGST